MNPDELHLVMTGETRRWDRDLAEAADWSEWQDAPVPAGYDTVYGYMSRHEPHVLGYMEEPMEGMAEDQERFMAEAEEEGLKVVKVPAPTALRRFGVETAMAFPVVQFLTEAGINGPGAAWMAKIVDAYYQPKETAPEALTEDELISKAMEIMRRRANGPAVAA